ncbi:MAG: hypothetical protein KA118_01865 [Verrucomicrobia bacterium]|nr:hypothetical protein [Verrucomicrobiota bacterium]
MPRLSTANEEVVATAGRRLSGVCRAAVFTGVAAVSLGATVLRHELLHWAGVRLAGGQVLSVSVFPQSWLVAIEWAPPLRGGAWSQAVPAGLPYLVDWVLMAISPWVLRWRLRPGVRRAIFQHLLYFAALDICVNCMVGFWVSNDWAVLAGPPRVRLVVLPLVILLTLALAVWRGGWRLKGCGAVPDANRFSGNTFSLQREK